MRRVRAGFCALLVLGGTAGAASAANTPAGLWTTIDDRSGLARSQVRIYEQDGAWFGRIEKILIPGKHDRCVLCTDERRDQPALGLVIVRNMRKTATDKEWAGGDILDPEQGTVYSSRMVLGADGKTLEVRGFVGLSLFGRSQTWVRVTP